MIPLEKIVNVSKDEELDPLQKVKRELAKGKASSQVQQTQQALDGYLTDCSYEEHLNFEIVSFCLFKHEEETK